MQSNYYQLYQTFICNRSVVFKTKTYSVDRFEYLERSEADEGGSNPQNNSTLLVYWVAVI